jgi:hypothetical protein
MIETILHDYCENCHDIEPTFKKNTLYRCGNIPVVTTVQVSCNNYYKCDRIHSMMKQKCDKEI